MSVLLDALKKAALEKQRKQADISASKNTTEEKETYLNLDIEIDEDLLNDSLNESTSETLLEKNTNDTAIAFKKEDDNAHKIQINAQKTTHNETKINALNKNTDKTANTANTANNVNSKTVPQTNTSPTSSITKPNETKPNTPEPKKDKNTGLLNKQSNQELIESFNLIRENKEKKIKQKKIAFTITYIFLILLMISVCGGYYYIQKQNKVSYYPPIKDSALKVINTDETINQSEIEEPIKPQHNPQEIKPETKPIDSPNQKYKTVKDNTLLSNTAPTPSTPSIPSTKETTNISTIKKTKPIQKKSNSLITKKSSFSGNKISSNKKSENTNIINTSNTSNKILSDSLLKAYSAYQNGNTSEAKEFYNQALSISPHNADALLGRAAVAIMEKDYKNALQHYQTRLSDNPKDDYALSGILGLSSLTQYNGDLVASVNTLLENNPNAAHLQFLKGNIEARANNWKSAQQHFFNAWSAEPSSANYAYNVAVALDHIKKPQQAIVFYNKALLLSTNSVFNFNKVHVNNRIISLEKIGE